MLDPVWASMIRLGHIIAFQRQSRLLEQSCK